MFVLVNDKHHAQLMHEYLHYRRRLPHQIRGVILVCAVIQRQFYPVWKAPVLSVFGDADGEIPLSRSDSLCFFYTLSVILCSIAEQYAVMYLSNRSRTNENIRERPIVIMNKVSHERLRNDHVFIHFRVAFLTFLSFRMF